MTDVRNWGGCAQAGVALAFCVAVCRTAFKASGGIAAGLLSVAADATANVHLPCPLPPPTRCLRMVPCPQGSDHHAGCTRRLAGATSPAGRQQRYHLGLKGLHVCCNACMLFTVGCREACQQDLTSPAHTEGRSPRLLPPSACQGRRGTNARRCCQASPPPLARRLPPAPSGPSWRRSAWGASSTCAGRCGWWSAPSTWVSGGVGYSSTEMNLAQRQQDSSDAAMVVRILCMVKQRVQYWCDKCTATGQS